MTERIKCIKAKTFLLIILVVLLAYCFLWLVVASYYCVPNVEDFSFAQKARDHGLWYMVSSFLISHYTRYTSTFFYGFNPLTINRPDLFMWMPISSMIFMISGIYFLLTSTIQHKSSKLLILIFAALLSAMHYALQPSLPYGLTYMASIFVYFYPWFFTFIWTGALIRSIHSNNGVLYPFYSTLGCFALLFSYGCVELFVFINPFILLIFILYFLVYNKKNIRHLVPYIIVSLGCGLFILSCPSGKLNPNNLTTDISQRYVGSHFFIEAARANFQYIQHYLLHPVSILFTLSSTLLLTWFRSRIELPVFRNSKVWLYMLLAFIAGAFVSSLVWFIPKGVNGDFPKYIFNATSVLYQTGLWVLLPLYLSEPLSKKWSMKSIRYSAALVVFVLLCCVYFTKNNISTIQKEYQNGSLQSLKHNYTDFVIAASKAKKNPTGENIVFFKNPDVIPTSVYLEHDILANRASACWNATYEDYFGVNEVRLVGDTFSNP